MTPDIYRHRLNALVAAAIVDGVSAAEVSAMLVCAAASVSGAAIGARTETVDAMCEAAVEAMRRAAIGGSDDS
jgi:hypothetical protein